MSARARALLLTALAASLALAAPAASPAHDGAHVEVDAAGNAFTGGLAFDPADIEVVVGEHVRWTNTDIIVPHTATEDHDLWDLTGTYGATPLTPPGFGPGDTRERRFEAGSWSYFCRVHPVDMRGTVEVPVTLRSRRTGTRKSKPRFAVTARWSRTELPEGQVFDVQMRRAGGPWRLVREDTRQLSLRAGSLRKGTRLAYRARVHLRDDAEASSGWSPPARIRTG